MKKYKFRFMSSTKSLRLHDKIHRPLRYAFKWIWEPLEEKLNKEEDD